MSRVEKEVDEVIRMYFTEYTSFESVKDNWNEGKY